MLNRVKAGLSLSAQHRGCPSHRTEAKASEGRSVLMCSAQEVSPGGVSGTSAGKGQGFSGCFTPGHPGRAVGSKARRFESMLIQGCPSKLSKAEVLWAWSVPGCFVPVCPWHKGWSGPEH